MHDRNKHNKYIQQRHHQLSHDDTTTIMTNTMHKQQAHRSQVQGPICNQHVDTKTHSSKWNGNKTSPKENGTML